MSKLCFPAKVLDQHLVVLGKTGAGKSSALRHVVEHLLSHQKRVCIIDPKGDWWGLKSSADGKSAGFPIIAFGDFKEPKASDIPINPQSGKHVAELITSGNRPCIVGFRGWMPGQMTDFWLDFAATLFNSSKGELFVVIDEVHNFAPKGKILDPKAGRVLHWSNRLLSEGRGLGLIFLIASQRPQKVHNDTLTCCETLVAMRVNHAADRGAVKEWIDGCGDKQHGQEVLNSVAGMARGEAFIWSPEIGFGPERVKFPLFETFDSFAPPQLQKNVSQSGWSEINLEAVKEKLARVIQEAKANDPGELKRKIAELERQLRTQPAGQPDEAVIRRAVDDAVRGLHREYERQQAGARALIENMRRSFVSIGEVCKKLTDAAMAPAIIASNIAIAGSAIVPVPRPVAAPRPAPAPQPRLHASNGDASLSGPEQRILNAIAWLNSISVSDPQLTAVAFLAGYTIGGGAFNNPKGALRSKGLVEYLPGERIRLTAEGQAIAQAPETPLDAAELQRNVLERLPGPERKILGVLLEHPQGLSNEELAEHSGYAQGGGAFNNPKGRLRSLGLIAYRSGLVVPEPLLFLEN